MRSPAPSRQDHRALRCSGLPPGGKLGVYGFGGSAHLTAQMAIYEGASVYVMTRSAGAQRLALDLGAEFAGPADADPPALLDAAILFAPAGGLVPIALRALDRGGTLAVAGIHLSDIPVLDYQRDLFQERHLRSVTANTRADGREFLALAERMPLRPTTVPYPWTKADRHCWTCPKTATREPLCCFDQPDRNRVSLVTFDPRRIAGSRGKYCHER